MSSSSLGRRSVLAGALAGALLPALTPTAAHAATETTAPRTRQDLLAYVGSRTTTARDARGAGITVWKASTDGSPWRLLQTVAADDGTGRGGIPANPTFLIFSADGTRAYCTHGDLQLASSFTVDPVTGHLTHLNTMATGHTNPVHLSLSPDGQWLVLANFAAPGDLCTLAIEADGRLGPVAARLQLPGEPGRTKELQEGAHPHHVPWDPTGRWILVPDRGLDVVHIVALDPATGALSLHAQSRFRPADGPRHLLFHPGKDLVYVVNEISCSVTTCLWDPHQGRLTPIHALRTTPPTDLRDMTGAEIAIADSGRYLYVSNRSGTGGAATAGPGHDSLTVLELGRRDGIPTVDEVFSAQGQRPRFIGTDPGSHNLYAANELTDTISGFTLSPQGNVTRENGIIARTGSPVCIVFRQP